ncbi:Oidioi.mRNA.OKI2018_I69.chr2.g7660.t1.cds [Oikopleura dioica]|uniref:Oidioi.mRNA.OKI2018_I69.chr2.g7660.t1.cds n=1 Tax=Oikopleura dioica TaxID=34765 RepID=A0ABN7T7E0_OIKDI|nr:Oidioi.mRNA.OKI2018_I69.chr2.g7660.t1.cds [Oikopleura dioica]
MNPKESESKIVVYGKEILMPSFGRGNPTYPLKIGEDPVKKAGSSVSLVSRDIKLLSGVWQQVKCENVWRYNLAIGHDLFWSLASNFFAPIIKYNFPDEESFRVRIITETGWSWFQGQKITQTFDLNGINDHDCPMSTGPSWSKASTAGTSSSTETSGAMKTITQNVLLDEDNETIVSYAVGHSCGPITTTRRVLDNGQLEWTATLENHKITCRRLFAKIDEIPARFCEPALPL